MTSETASLTPPARSLLSECREIARARLAEVIATALAKIDEDLFQLADKSIKRDEQQIYLDAMTRVRKHRSDIQREFEEAFRAIYDRKLESEREKKPAAPADPFGGLELSLVSDSIIETGIAIDRLAKTVMSAVDNNELLGIRARLGALLNRDALEDADNPLSPEAIFEALKLACNHIPAEDAVKQALLSAFQPYLSRSITRIYQAVNESLVAHHILPRIRHTVKTTADPMGVSQRMMGMSATQRMQALSQSGRMKQFDGGPERSGWLGGGLGNEQAALASLLAGLAQGQASARVEALSFLADPAALAAQRSAPASTALLDTLARLQSEANLGVGAGFLAPGFLRELDRGLISQGTPLDQMTIELVTVVFDYLHQNEKLADTVKGLIDRLQIVAVKAALLDRSFFASREHPMRRLLDRMAEAGTDPAVRSAEDADFVRGLRHVVDDLAVKFRDDVGVFAVAQDELDRLIALEHSAAEAAASAQASALAEQEAHAAAHAAARADLAARIKPDTPAFVREFLAGTWQEAVSDAQLRRLEGDDSVAARLNLAADLIWSIEPKGRTDIPVLAGMLPRLVRGLMRGVMARGMPEAARQAFFNQLMKAHTEAIAAAKAATVDVPSQPVPSATGELPTLKLVPLIEAGDAWQRTVLELAKGATLAFSDEGARETFKLTWVSPKRTFYLFCNGSRMRQMSATALAGMLRTGAAALADQAMPLVDRAIDAMARAEPAVEWAAA